MNRLGILLVFLAIGALETRVNAQTDMPGGDLPRVFETLWGEIETLDEKDQHRLKAQFLQSVAVSGDQALIDTWERQLGETAGPLVPFENYALMKVSDFVEAHGWKAFFTRAELKERPFNSGRPEMMAAAAEHLADTKTAARILKLMERLANADVSEAAFERASFGHVLAEAAMRRCDLYAFDRALLLTDAPEALRYAVWRTRMIGELGDVLSRLQDAPEESRAMYVRQVTDGLYDVLALESCSAGNENL